MNFANSVGFIYLIICLVITILRSNLQYMNQLTCLGRGEELIFYYVFISRSQNNQCDTEFDDEHPEPKGPKCDGGFNAGSTQSALIFWGPFIFCSLLYLRITRRRGYSLQLDIIFQGCVTYPVL